MTPLNKEAKMRKHTFQLGLCSFLVLYFGLVGSLMFGQRVTGKLTGEVRDEQGAPLPGVTVEISSPSLMGGPRSQITTETGTYHFISLPPGTYKVVFSLSGFQKVEKPNVKVSLNMTVTEDVVLKQSVVEETIEVTAESPVVDVTKSGVSTTFSAEQIENIPSGRFTVFDIIKQTPGIPQTEQWEWRNAAFGSNYESNAYLVDGVDISSPDLGHAWNWQPQDMYEEVEFSGIGAPAEYGSFTGAVINIVTKSGGNTYSGTFSYYGQYQDLTDDNNPGAGAVPSISPDKVYSYHRDKYLNASFNLGGPIVKDKLWFFGLYERTDDSYSPWLINPKVPNQYLGNKGIIKLSSQLGVKHKLVGSYYYENFEFPYSPDEYTMPESVSDETGHTNQWNLLYTFLISNKAFFDFKYSHWATTDDFLPSMGGSINDPFYSDWYYGTTWGAPSWVWMGTMARDQANASLTYFAEDFLGGDHDFKAGVQYAKGDSEWSGGYPGGKYYIYYAGYPYYLYEQQPFMYGGKSNALGAFIDDSWKIGERLTVNLGLRYDHSNASIPSWNVLDGWEKTSQTVPGLDDLIVWDTIAPRLGLAFQLTSDHKTLLRASYGRYYAAIHGNNYIYPGPAATDWTIYTYDWDIEGWSKWYTIPGEMGYTIDPNLKNPYADVYSVGLERELLPNLSVGATYIYKEEKDLLGWEDRGATYVPVSLVSPDNGQTYPAYNQTSELGTSNQYWITNPSTFGHTYQAAILSLSKRYSNNWQLFTSVTWSKAEGLDVTAHSTHSWALLLNTGYFGRDPNDLTNSTGLLNHDRTWIFKLQASYTFPWEIVASLNYLYQTGTPIPTFVRIYPDQGQQHILAEPKGPVRYDPWSLLDLRLQKTFNLYKSLRLDAMVDAFNLFNSATVTVDRSHDLWEQAYNEPSEIFYPRRLQVGLRLRF
jgi:Carboxypeptidase regulatory-like domain/TonB dependent receptor-like, beta-barrel